MVQCMNTATQLRDDNEQNAKFNKFQGKEEHEGQILITIDRLSLVMLAALYLCQCHDVVGRSI